jgi:hypothetical protein
VNRETTQIGKSANGEIMSRQPTMTLGYLLLAAILLAALSYWAPWVNHSTAALKLSGQDLGEFAKFIPDIRRGHMRFPRQLFYLPPFVCVACLVLLSTNRQLPYPRWLRVVMLALAVLLLPGLLPPVWGHPKDLFTQEFRLQGIAFILGLLLIAAHGVFRVLSLRTLSLALVVLALIGLIPAQWAFWAIRPRIWAAYNTPTVHLGWGLWLDIVAWVGLLAVAALFYRSRNAE